MKSSVGVSLILASIAGLTVGCSGASRSAPTQDLSHPETVAIDFYSGAHKSAACSGTLLARNVVLTTASCAQGAGGARVVAPHANHQTATVAFALDYDWQDGDASSAQNKENDLAVLILRESINISKYPFIEKSSCEGCSVFTVSRTGSSATTTTLQTSKTLRVAMGAPAGHPTALYLPQGTAGSGGVVMHVDSRGTTTLAGVMIGQGQKTGGGYVARLSDPHVQTWLTTILAVAKQTPVAGGSSTKSIHALDFPPDPGSSSGDPNASDDPNASSSSGDPNASSGSDDPNAGSSSGDPNASPGSTSGDPALADGTDPNAPPAQAPGIDEPVAPSGPPPASAAGDTAPQQWDQTAMSDQYKCIRAAINHGVDPEGCAVIQT